MEYLTTTRPNSRVVVLFIYLTGLLKLGFSLCGHYLEKQILSL
ncbi:MAG: hypothetical protein KatS3mg033_1171 [Thermonema sp.]|nr:MAG: hypothetical protein KatS3mg033_1171 [Thermonema sp.]